MDDSTYKKETLRVLLPLYYNRLFPKELLHKWLCYGNANNFNRREIAFTLLGDVFFRFQAFNTLDAFAGVLSQKSPVKFDIGAIYKYPLKGPMRSNKTPIEREIVFDIDLTDYDVIRTCCTGAGVCHKCWKFMTIACKILDAALRDDFGYNQILWVFSGRRGVHCWVSDKVARKCDDTSRRALAEYLQVIKGTMSARKVKLPNDLHPSLCRSLDIIDEYFESVCLKEQDILGTDQRLKEFLQQIVNEGLRSIFNDAMLKVCTSAKRWTAFEETFNKLYREQKIPKGMQHMIQEMKLWYAYPRLDINVTKSTNHLLKAPFCVHPETGKISVPFNPKFIDQFDPLAVPTINVLVNEIKSYDAKTKEPSVSTSKNKGYQQTSLLKYVSVFVDFLRGLHMAAVEERVKGNGNLAH